MMEGISSRGRLARRPPQARRTSAGSTTTTTSRSRATPSSRSARTSPRASSATAGTSRASATPTTSRCSAARSRRSRATTDRPTLIIVDSHIGYGAPTKQDTHAAHGEPLGEEEIRLTKKAYGWPEDAKFLVPDGVREHFAAGIGERGRTLREAWMEHFERYKEEYPDLADQLLRMQRRELPDGWDAEIPEFPPDAKGLAGARVLGQVLTRSPRTSRGCSAARPTSRRRPRPA